MDYETAFSALLAIDREIALWEHIDAVLDWDSKISAPAAAAEERGKQRALVLSRAHEAASSDRMGDILSDLGADGDHPEGKGRDDFEKGLIRQRYTEWERNRKLPASLVSREAALASSGYAAWVAARRDDDFSALLPALEKNFALAREKAALLRKDGQTLYDALLDLFEPGLTEGECDSLFSAVQPVVQEIMAGMKEKNEDNHFLLREYSLEGQDIIQKEVVRRMGFDFSRGLKGVSPHPFTTTLGCDDVRITTRYTDPNVMDSFYSTVHETGHALYEQHAASGRVRGTTLSNGASYALHESQSRLWENIIGRSRPFLSWCFPLFTKTFPAQFSGVTEKRFYRAVNRVEATPIRCQADEVSYNLHIILRYDMEKRLIDGGLEAKDIAEAWREEYKELFGVPLETDREGCLQDDHWSEALVGYFPSYAIGNFYGAQIWDTLRSEIDADSLMEKGEFSVLSDWLGEHVWRYGMTYTPKDLIRRVTGRKLDAVFFVRYLETKYRGGLL